VGQKVNPIGLRLGINKTWDSRWYSQRDFSKYLRDDLAIRKFVAGKYTEAGIAKVEIERAAKQLVVKLHTARPGKIIGKQGKEIEVLRDEIKKVVKSSDRSVKVDVYEVKNPDLNAKLASLNVAQQLEKRVSFRRAMKKVMQQVMKAGAKGVKVRVSGRLNGAEMARTEWYLESRVPLHTLRADIDYGFSEAFTTYGAIGVKVWIFRGEIYEKSGQTKSGRPAEE
jgi:small subunit ribosomal protein S3